MNERIIVSMTSYPARINNVPMSFFCLLKKQTRPPDEIHLWLAEPEFPNRMDDLPYDLQLLLKLPCIFIHWVPKNTYCHKRHEIFKLCVSNDLVFFIDDDVMYDNKLIERCIELHKQQPNAIINYTDYGSIWFNGLHLVSGNRNNHPSKFNRYCGQSMCPASVYPKECLTDEMTSIRDTVCPVCDEIWMMQFILARDILVMSAGFPWGRELNHYNCNSIGIVSKVHNLDKRGLNFRDYQLIKLFHHFPDNKKMCVERCGYMAH